MKDVLVLGGPNGAGKTTAAPTVLAKYLGIREFVNADEIARGLSPFNPDGAAIGAARLMVGRIRELSQQGQSFAFETTCAGRRYLRLLRLCRAEGYRLTLVFLWLPSQQAALARVAKRVREGGHGIPKEVVVRRFDVGLRNMRHLYLPLVDVALVYDNSDQGRVLIAEKSPEISLRVHDPKRWALIEKATKWPT